MKKIICFLFFVFNGSTGLFSQTSAWQNDLVICRSTDGINFSNIQVFQDSSGVPCIVRDTNGVLISAFQWFPAPQFSQYWDRVAVKFSYDDGLTWTAPTPISIPNLPANHQRPFDPTLTLTDSGQIRIYFSCSPVPVVDSMIGTFSAISNDGINYTWEPGYRFHPPAQRAIDPAVLKLNGMWHLTCPKGAPQDGAFHAISGDGINFNQVPDITSDNNHNWTGNLMLDNTNMRFYGTGAMGNPIWYSSTPNGGMWNPYVNTNQYGGDPAVVKLPSGEYVMIYTWLGNFTGIENNSVGNDEIKIFPNPVTEKFRVQSSRFRVDRIEIFDLRGRKIQSQEFSIENDFFISIKNMESGVFLLKIYDESGNKFAIKKFCRE